MRFPDKEQVKALARDGTAMRGPGTCPTTLLSAAVRRHPLGRVPTSRRDATP